MVKYEDFEKLSKVVKTNKKRLYNLYILLGLKDFRRWADLRAKEIYLRRCLNW
jgi:hypothetical protein